jgi:predicted O-methyltransferase YrrM
VSDDIERILTASAAIPGWTAGDDAREVALASYALPAPAIIAEIGVFMGRCTALLAGARRLRRSGKVHCVDPFDCSGDGFSVPFYLSELKATGKTSLVEVFCSNMAKCQLDDWIELHTGRAADVAARWSQPLDLLLLDGDQSPHGARTAYESWIPFLKHGGIIIVRNTRDRQYAEGHDGHRRLAVEEVAAPRYSNIRQVGATTFAVKQF